MANSYRKEHHKLYKDDDKMMEMTKLISPVQAYLESGTRAYMLHIFMSALKVCTLGVTFDPIRFDSCHSNELPNYAKTSLEEKNLGNPRSC